MEVFNRFESEVRSYCRSFPTVFTKALGCRLVDEAGTEYLDFFSGAGALNYGHNNPRLKRKLLEYLMEDGILHSLDMATTAKRTFIERFQRIILAPRSLSYRLQFPGPTGTNCVEAALKLARKVTRRTNVLFFTNAYHGMTLGALAVTGHAVKRAGGGVPLANAMPVPFDGALGPRYDTLEILERLLADHASGVDRPAAVIVETVQAEGGIHVARFEWLQRLAALLRAHEVLLIVDEIQVGCGRTGPFFSFEPAGIQPDIVCLSKSIGGLGLPMALVLIRPELDVWLPGEHNGTFRGNNLAFVAGAEALSYWEDDTLSREVERKGRLVSRRLQEICDAFPEAEGVVRGRGLIQGIDFAVPGLASGVARAAFRRGLVIETAGFTDRVLKLLPPLIVEDADLERGLERIAASVPEAMAALPQLQRQAVGV